MRWQVQHAQWSDQPAILSLYRRVAHTPGFLARSAEEIDAPFVADILSSSLANGLIMSLSRSNESGLIGLIHAERGTPFSLRHVLAHLTILIDPEFQGQGAGRFLFSSFLTEVANRRQDILRVELRARSSNQYALKLYTSLGFQSEGRFSRRIRNPNGEYEDGIPMAWINPNWQNNDIDHILDI